MIRFLKTFFILALPFSSAVAGDTTFTLARELLAERDYTLAAVEFRRVAMESPEADAKCSAYLYAGYAYLEARNHISAGEMLDRAEAAGESDDHAADLLLLNAENARMENDTDTALYFYDVLAADSGETGFQTFSLRRSAAIHLAHGDLTQARQNLERSPADETVALEALKSYAAGKDKSPLIGGLWGLIPGAGYWYSGEVANGFRSLILNSIFIYGMVDTARDEQWGALAIISFFEVTWYSGSIYGGVDAAHRHNQNRLNDAIHTIESDMSYRPDPSVVVPVFKLNIQF